MTQATTTKHTHGNVNDARYDDLRQVLQQKFVELAEGQPIFQTKATETLWDIYISQFNDPEVKQYHNCNTCRHFMQRYGGLVTISEEGKLTPVMWSVNGAEFNFDVLGALHKHVENSQVTGVFYSSEKVWGTPLTGHWSHFAVTPPSNLLHRHPVLTPGQMTAQKSEDWKNIRRALSEFKQPLLEKALAILKGETLYRSEKVIGPVQWLYDLHTALDNVGNNRRLRDNVLWLAISVAPDGFLHPRSGMAGTLLDDLAEGMAFEVVKSRFDKKMKPDTYRRPVAAPSDSTIQQAEKVFEKMGLQKALERRFSTLTEIELLWQPKIKEETVTSNSVFGHLKNKKPSEKETVTSKVSITWDKFKRTVLPEAQEIELYVTYDMNFGSILTAVHADAPPILQWDLEEQRNPFSWYVYTKGQARRPSHWGINSGFNKVSGICLQPSDWYGRQTPHMGEGFLLLIEDAKDSEHKGVGLFPEILRSELHSVRSVLEAYSNKAQLSGVENSVGGILLSKGGGGWKVLLKVKTKAITSLYELDRWD